MWKKLPYSQPFFLSFTEKQNNYNVYITNYINIWWHCYKEDEFLRILKKSNDDLEMENDDQFLQLGLRMLLEPESLKKLELIFEKNTLNVSMTLTNRFPVYLDIQLAEGSREMFFEKITQQLLKTIYDLKTSENELRSLLLKKDKEIEEYKCEADVRLAMYLKTAIFHDEEHMAKHTMYKKNFGSLDVPECILEKVIEKPEDEVTVKQENGDAELPTVKVEIDSQQPNKTEQESHVPEINNQNTFSTETIINKREIKSEQLNVSPRKKLRKMLKI